MLTAPTPPPPPPPLTHAAATARSLARTPLARHCHRSLAHRRHHCLPDRISHARACTPALALARTRLPALARCCLHSRHHRHRTLNRHPAPRRANLHLAAPICTSLLPSARHTLAYVPDTLAVPAARGSNIRQCGGTDLLGGSEATGWQKYVRILGEQKIVIGRKGTHALEGVAAMAAATWANDD
jgi:hypothetical protein